MALVRSFIWVVLTLTTWDDITRPKFRGGLGIIRKTRAVNVALLGKKVWSIIKDPYKLWVRLFSDKYLCHSPYGHH